MKKEIISDERLNNFTEENLMKGLLADEDDFKLETSTNKTLPKLEKGSYLFMVGKTNETLEDNWEAKLAIKNIPVLPHIINSVKELRKYYIDGIQIGYKYGIIKHEADGYVWTKEDVDLILCNMYSKDEVLELLANYQVAATLKCKTALLNSKEWFNNNKK